MVKSDEKLITEAEKAYQQSTGNKLEL